MKKIISLFAAALVSALALVSCVKEETKNPTEGESFTVNFMAQNPETKTVFGDITEGASSVPTLWENEDAISVSCNLNGTYAKKTTVTPLEGGKAAEFSVEFTSIPTADDYTFYAIYPFTDKAYASGKGKISIPDVQTPRENGIAQNAMGLIAKSETFSSKPTEAVALSFRHVAAYGCITKLDGVPSTAVISSITITAENDITGTFQTDFETPALEASDAKKTLTLTTSAHENIWFSCAPFEGGKVTFEVLTDDGTYTVEKDFTGRKFEAGKIAKFGVTGFEKSGAADVVYTLVKSVDELVEGANVIIAAKDANYALGTEATSADKKNRKEVSINCNADGDIINPSESVEILTLEKGNATGTGVFSLKANTWNGYLSITSDANELKTVSDISDNSTWTITFDSANGAYINNVAYTERYLRYNPNNNIFNGYKGTTTDKNKSTNQNIEIYIDAASVLPSLQTPEITVDKNVSDPYTIDVTWLVVENATSYTVTCTGQEDKTIEHADIMETSFSGLTDGDYVVTVTAKADGFKPATATSEIHIGLASRNLAFEKNEVTVAVNYEGIPNSLSGITDGVQYSSSDEDIAMVIPQTGEIMAFAEGTVTITATAPATSEYAAGTASYTLIVTNVSIGPSTGDILFQETWGTYTGAVSTYDFSGTTTYGGDVNGLAYSVTNNNDKVENISAGSINTSNLFFYKDAVSSFKITGIKLHGVSNIKLSFLTNGTNFKVSYSVDNGTSTSLMNSCEKGSNETTISNLNGSTLTLVFEKTGTKNNRLDDITITVAE